MKERDNINCHFKQTCNQGTSSSENIIFPNFTGFMQEIGCFHGDSGASLPTHWIQERAGSGGDTLKP